MEKPGILTERNVVVEVIEKYRKLTYLWNPTHKLYTNKNARRQGLEIMLESWRKLEPNASLECMRKKLNNWRAAYRRERKKIEDSVRSATEPDEIHKPNLWYFGYLKFLDDDCPVLLKDDEEDESFNITMHAETENTIEGTEDDDVEDENFETEEEEDEIKEEPEKKSRMSVKRKASDESSKLEQLVDTSAQVFVHSNDESSADLFGRAIGSQLKEVSKFQRCLAEKLISEIMFYAKLEQLSIGSSINLEVPNS